MKRFFYVVFFMFLFVITPLSACADDLEITGSAVAIRNAPTTSGSKVLIRVNKGAAFSLKSSSIVSDQGKNGECDTGWYQINYDNQDAYVCAKYGKVLTTAPVNGEAKSACENELKERGFPQEYWNGICNIKVAHPNWNFIAVQTGLDFSVAVSRESSCGTNTLVTNNPEFIDTSCNKKHDTGYSHASQKAVAYYLNPLNFLDEKNIFMFESNYVNTSIGDDTYVAIVNRRLANYIKLLPTMSNALNTACKINNVNQVMLSSRIVQELGNTGLATSGNFNGQILSCISGAYTARYGTLLNGKSMDYYYNFFNVGVYDGSNGDAAYRAVKYAAEHGWGGTGDQATDLTLAIGGGASFLKNKYMDQGQYTMYSQKFNVHPVSASSLYVNQYMSNLKAPTSEASIAYNAYKNAGALESNFNFYIPIYTNLDAKIENSPSGPTGGDGNNTSGGLDIPTILVSVGYKVSGNKIMGIEPGASLDEFKAKINSLGGTIVSTSSNVLGTGNVIKISNGSSTLDYIVVIKGDTSGDGIINALDLLQVQKNILGQYQLKDANMLAGDPSGDSKVDALDLLQIQKNILGQYKITQ